MKAPSPRLPKAASKGDALAERDLLSVPLAEIFDWAIGDVDNGRPAAYPPIAKHVKPLLPMWVQHNVGAATQSGCDTYIEVRCRAISRISKNPLRYTTAKMEVRTLLSMIRAFARDKKLKCTLATTYKEPPSKIVDHTLTRDDVVRLLQACWGKRWDGTKMARMTAARPPRRLLARQRRHMARYILLAALLGTGDALMRRLRWQPAAQGEPPHSWIDVEKRNLHRLGPDAPRLAAYHDVAVRIPRFLTWNLRKWRDQDLRDGIPYVLGSAGEKCGRAGALASILTDANLQDVSIRTLIDTFAANAMRQPGTSLFGLAIALGRTLRQVKPKYRHFRPDFQAAAVAGIRARPAALSKKTTAPAAEKSREARRDRSISDGRSA